MNSSPKVLPKFCLLQVSKVPIRTWGKGREGRRRRGETCPNTQARAKKRVSVCVVKQNWNRENREERSFEVAWSGIQKKQRHACAKMLCVSPGKVRGSGGGGLGSRWLQDR